MSCSDGAALNGETGNDFKSETNVCDDTNRAQDPADTERINASESGEKSINLNDERSMYVLGNEMINIDAEGSGDSKVKMEVSTQKVSSGEENNVGAEKIQSEERVYSSGESTVRPTTANYYWEKVGQKIL